MNIEQVRDYALDKPFADEAMPFGEGTLVFRVMEKAFIFTGLDQEYFTLNLKADPEYVLELRERYPAILPGYHMNKKHWNSVNVDQLGDWKFIRHLIDHSYEQVVKGLPKYKQELIAERLRAE